MKGRFLKKTLAASWALMIAAGSVPTYSKTVTVDLGNGHEELAKKFSGISGYTVNSTKISYAVPNNKYTVGKVEEDFSNRAREIALGKVIDADGNYNTYLTDNISINVEDGDFVSFDPKTSRFEISVPIEHDLDENGVCTYCGKRNYSDGIGERLMGYSLSLEGDIGVNFYMELDDSVVAHSETAYIRFTTPKGSDTETKTVLVKDAVQKQLDGKTYYMFKCNVSAKDMASEITAQMFDGDKAGTEYKYSVKDYADYLLAHTEDSEEYAKAAPLVKAKLNYGAYSQSYFSIEGTAANAGLPEGTVFTCGDKTVESVKNGKYVIARIRGIKASELENDFTVTFKGVSVTYNAMTYCYNVLNGGSDDEDLQNVCKALYLYAEEASKYFGGNN